jgi:hypothetical protein
VNAIVLTYAASFRFFLPLVVRMTARREVVISQKTRRRVRMTAAGRVVILPLKHESPPLRAGFFLSTSSLAIQGVIIGAMAPVFALWIVGVRRFLSLGGLTRFSELPHSRSFLSIDAESRSFALLRMTSGGAGFSAPGRILAPGIPGQPPHSSQKKA